MRIGVPKESLPGEERVAVTPESAAALLAMGFAVHVERGAGASAGHADGAYQAAGATIAPDAAAVLGSSDLVLKVRPPTVGEAGLLREKGVLACLLDPDRRPDVMAVLVERKVTAIALERIPRVTRAQSMDVLSSMANVAGYRAIVEAAAHYEGFFGPQVTAAGSMPPARVLVIGAGVAGLAAIAAARALGATVVAFDTRAAAREQGESLGATFLAVPVVESGEGSGGYGKAMSAAFLEAEVKLFEEQAKDLDVIVTTALVPGQRAPILLPRRVVEAMRPGSVIVDLAAEQGGNCELCVPGEVNVHAGVTVLGFVDLPSRMARTASRLFASNVVHLVTEMGRAESFRVDLDNDVVGPAVACHDGAVLAPRRAPAAAPAAAAAGPPSAPATVDAAARRPASPPPPDARPEQTEIQNPTRRAWGNTLVGMFIIAALFALGRFAPGDFLQHFTVFILACFVGWQVIWSVTPALHTPLMSVTNAISGVILVGGMLQVGDHLDLASLLGALAVLFATFNVAGGFLVTQRMLRMFRKDEPR